MSLNKILNGLAMATALAWATPASAQKLVVLPGDAWAVDVTPDGNVVVGTANNFQTIKDGFIWRWREEPAPTIIPGGDMVAVSDDGTVVAGNIFDASIGHMVAARWTAATGWQSLGWLPDALNCTDPIDPSAAYDISGDGTTIVGLSWATGCNARGFRWTAATGMQELQKLTTGSNRCSAISGDGSTMGGFAFGGFSGRTPAYWAANTSGAVIDSTLSGEVHGLSENGNLSVGTMYFSGPAFSAFIRNAQTGAITNLGHLNPTWAGKAWDISEDGKTVVGFDLYGGARQAWVWTASDGIISMKNRLTNAGVTNIPDLWTCLACSDDGNVVVGGGVNTTDVIGYIAEFSSPQPQWTKLGNALAGSVGLPKLNGTGALTAGTPTAVTISNAKANTPALLYIGFSAMNAPFKQGVLVPSVDLDPIGLFLPGSGSAAFQFTWPAGVPAGFDTYWQVWIKDSAGPAGLAATNALKSTAQ